VTENSSPEPRSPIDDALDADAIASRSGRPGWLSATVAAVFGLLFAFYLYEAISQAIALSQYVSGQNKLLDKLGHGLLSYPWIVIVIYLLLPFVTYGFAFVLGRRRTFIVRIGLFVMALAALSAGSLTLGSIASAATRIT
jgi:hypothetical protein